MTAPTTIDGAMMNDAYLERERALAAHGIEPLEESAASERAAFRNGWHAALLSASKPAVPQGFAIKRVEGHGWIIDPPSGSRWVAYEGTPAGELIQALSASTSANVAQGAEAVEFKWPALPELPKPFLDSAKSGAIFTEHQMQAYANAYGEAVRDAKFPKVAGLNEREQFIRNQGYAECLEDRDAKSARASEGK